MELRYPNITGTTEREMVMQIKSYLNQLVPQLEFAISNISTVPTATAIATTTKVVSSAPTNADASATFNSIKSLIIKSAEIVNAYYDEINKRLEGIYVAESDFGTFVEQTTADIEANSTSITQNYTDTQTLITDIDATVKKIDTRATIKSGLLDYDKDGVPVYGIEIGQRDNLDDEKLSRRFARFTADRLSFFDENENEVAYISDYWLEIYNAKILYSQSIGGFTDKVLTNGDVVTQWIEPGGEG